jgi:aminoglycoside phosphotransferase
MSLCSSKTIDPAPLILWAKNLLETEVEVRPARSGERSFVYELSTVNKSWFLKIDHSLNQEYERLIWLQNRASVPNVIGFTSYG